ncbi:MAG: hypothetical protein HYV63_28085 [Candidatus Schekmanbacteria bacterium]|nr:hypothetical protein [Candidatus Schekmanbacteria bacterium]
MQAQKGGAEIQKTAAHAGLPAGRQAGMSSGFLNLRTAFLSLHPFADGKCKGHSPHELLTGERVASWLEKLGYDRGPLGQVRSFKSLGWKRLVSPFEANWRQHWGPPGTPACRQAGAPRADRSGRQAPWKALARSSNPPPDWFADQAEARGRIAPAGGTRLYAGRCKGHFAEAQKALTALQVT